MLEILRDAFSFCQEGSSKVCPVSLWLFSLCLSLFGLKSFFQIITLFTTFCLTLAFTSI